MYAGTVLHIHFVTDKNKVHIATNNGIEPETAIITGSYIANNSGVGGNETIVAELWLFIFYGKYDWHEGSL
jgi:hypothetical protein